jgi:hypothetical protein
MTAHPYGDPNRCRSARLAGFVIHLYDDVCPTWDAQGKLGVRLVIRRAGRTVYAGGPVRLGLGCATDSDRALADSIALAVHCATHDDEGAYTGDNDGLTGLADEASMRFDGGAR